MAQWRGWRVVRGTPAGEQPVARYVCCYWGDRDGNAPLPVCEHKEDDTGDHRDDGEGDAAPPRGEDEVTPEVHLRLELLDLRVGRVGEPVAERHGHEGRVDAREERHLRDCTRGETTAEAAMSRQRPLRSAHETP